MRQQQKASYRFPACSRHVHNVGQLIVSFVDLKQLRPQCCSACGVDCESAVVTLVRSENPVQVPKSEKIDTRVMDGPTKIDPGNTLAAMASDASLEIEEDKDV